MLILRGIPASGKSTFALELMAKEPDRWLRVNKDSLRLMFHNGVYSPENEKFIDDAQTEMIIHTLKNDKKDLIVDNTHIPAKSVERLHKLAQEVADDLNVEIKITEWCFFTHLKTALERNAKRSGSARVPDDAIRKMHSQVEKSYNDSATGVREFQYKETTISPEVFVQIVHDETLPAAIICDLDGTIAHLNGRNPYDATGCSDDHPNKNVVNILNIHVDHQIFVTGREDKHREETLAFLNKHCIAPNRQLFMRKTGDFRKDCIVKREIFDEHIRDKFNVKFVLDDRDQVVKMWRRLGLTCLQVAEGDF
jgi:predicted kinase